MFTLFPNWQKREDVNAASLHLNIPHTHTQSITYREADHTELGCYSVRAQSEECYLANDDGVIIWKLVVGNLQVEGGGAFPDAA